MRGSAQSRMAIRLRQFFKKTSGSRALPLQEAPSTSPMRGSAQSRMTIRLR